MQRPAYIGQPGLKKTVATATLVNFCATPSTNMRQLDKRTSPRFDIPASFTLDSVQMEVKAA
jgi:hypothetical protein